MSQSNAKKNVFGLLLLILLGAGGYYLMQGSEFSSQKTEPPKPRRLKPLNNQTPPKAPKSSIYNESGELKNKGNTRPQKIAIQKSTKKEKKQYALAKEKQKQIRSDIKETLKAEFEMPENLNYSKLDLEEGVAGVVGVGTGDIKTFAALGTNLKVNDKMVIEFLNNSKGALPLSTGTSFKNKPSMQINAPGHTGIGKVKIFESNYDGTKAALLERRDGKGSYMIIMDANSGFFNTNEGYLERMLDNFKANSP